MGSEKFCLRWNDFETNISGSFRELRDDKDFFDVTLACGDEQIQAHKVILSACSPFFLNILRRNPHQHPLLYLKGVKFSDLQSVLNFMYHGEVNVAQEELNTFLSVAEDLRVKGLTQNKSRAVNDKRESYPTQPQTLKTSSNQRSSNMQAIPLPKRPRPPQPIPSSYPTEEDIQEIVPVKSEPSDTIPPTHQQSHPIISATSHLHPTQPSSQDLAQADDQSLACQENYEEDYGQYEGEHEYGGPMVVGTGDRNEGQFQDPSDLLQFVMDSIAANKRYQCSLCNYEHNVKANVRNHVESVHFPNTFQYPCDQCDQLFPSKNNVQLHRSRIHKQKIKHWEICLHIITIYLLQY